MPKKLIETGDKRLRDVLKESRTLFFAVAFFSLFVNLLMLTAPLYVLQVYDRVLSSKSVATLVTLSLLMTFLFIMMGCLDYIRSRLLARIGARFQHELDDVVFENELRGLKKTAGQADANDHIKDLNAVYRLFSSSAMTGLFDIPFTPIFLFIIALANPWLGLAALSGGALLIVITILNQKMTKTSAALSNADTFYADTFSTRMRTENQTITALGMTENARNRWVKLRQAMRKSTLDASDQQGQFMAISKTFRQFFQSTMLGLGAYLSIKGELSGGSMMAVSILLGRALAPIDLVIGQWSVLQRAGVAYRSLAAHLTEDQTQKAKTKLPCPNSHFQAQNVIVVPPGKSRPVLMDISFELEPGTAMGIIGSSGAGKSTLVQIMTGATPPTRGAIRLGGASLGHYTENDRSRYIGYLPQRVHLFDGTIAENISRLSLDPDDKKIVEAAKVAGAHELILSLDEGYNTKISSTNCQLSGGQVQRICLARALYLDPLVILLDEPNSNLDHEGTNALNLAIQAVKKRGGVVIIAAHRPAIIQQCEKLLVLDKGKITSFGDRDDVLKNTVRNSKQINSLHNTSGTSS